MFLGIDIGTSGVKVVLVGEHGEIAGESSAPLSISRPQPLYAEQDPEAWWQATTNAIETLAPGLRQQVRAIGLAGQMHGATLLNAADRPLRPAILWNDGRSALECAEIENAEPDARLITGSIIAPGFTAPKILWLRKHEPDLFREVAHVLMPKDYVRLKLTGEKITDMSDASGTAWLDVARRDWSDAMLSATGLDRRHMPKLVEGTAPAGILTREIADRLGLPRVVVAAGGGDNAASAAGMGVVEPGKAFLSLGTSGVLFVSTDRFRPNPAQAAHAFCHCLPDRWHQMAVILTAASALSWLSDLTRTGLHDLVTAAERRGLRRGAPFFLPYLSGERTPHNDPLSRGVFFGLGSDTSLADLAVAVLEGVALAFADGLDALDENITDITMTGGGTRIGWWSHLIAAALRRPVAYRQAGEIGAAYGAARLGQIAFTGEAAKDVCIPPPVVAIVEPEPALASLMAERRRIFRRLYPDLKSAFQEFAQ